MSETATTITHRDGFTVCTYHSTDVIAWDGKTLILDTGGWKTATTKRRMNDRMKEWGICGHVYQKDHEWYAYLPGRPGPSHYPFNGERLELDLS